MTRSRPAVAWEGAGHAGSDCKGERKLTINRSASLAVVMVPQGYTRENTVLTLNRHSLLYVRFSSIKLFKNTSTLRMTYLPSYQVRFPLHLPLYFFSTLLLSSGEGPVVPHHPVPRPRTCTVAAGPGDLTVEHSSRLVGHLIGTNHSWKFHRNPGWNH